jgi:hypothetical protein
MPTIDLRTLPSLPYVYSGTTPSTINTCQIILLPVQRGVQLTLHNREKAAKTLLLSFDGTLTQDGTAPSMGFSISEPTHIATDAASGVGFQPVTQMALWSGSASTTYELLFAAP